MGASTFRAPLDLSAADSAQHLWSPHSGAPVSLPPLHTGFTDTVFPTAAQAGAKGAPYDSTLTFTVVANTGLILFMFLMGLELDRSLLRKGLRQSVPMAAAAIVVPFAIGCGVATWLSDVNEEGKVPVAGAQQPSSTAFLLFAGAW